MNNIFQALHKNLLSVILVFLLISSFYIFYTRSSWVSEMTDFSPKTISIYSLDMGAFQGAGYTIADIDSYRDDFIARLGSDLKDEDIDAFTLRALGGSSVSLMLPTGYKSKVAQTAGRIVEAALPEHFFLSQSQFLDSSLASRHLVRLLQLLGWGILCLLLFLSVFYFSHLSMLLSFLVCLVLIMMCVFLLGIFKVGVSLDYHNIIGFICLVGIAVDNLILIFEEVHVRARDRFLIGDFKKAWRSQRPVILMANLTTVLAIAPMLLFIFDASIQAILWMIVVGIAVSLAITIGFVRLFYATDLSPAVWFEDQSKSVPWLQHGRDRLKSAMDKVLGFKFLWVPIAILLLIGSIQLHRLSLFTDGNWKQYAGLDLAGGWSAFMSPIEQDMETGDYLPMDSGMINPVEMKKVLSLVCWRQFKSECHVSSGQILDEDTGTHSARIFTVEGQFADSNGLGSTAPMRDQLFDETFLERGFEYSGTFGFLPGEEVNAIGPRMIQQNVKGLRFGLAWSAVLLVGCVLLFLGMISRQFRLWQRLCVGATVLVALVVDMVVLFWIMLSSGIQLKFATVAAVMTVVGYSINDSLIVVGHEGKLENLGMRIFLTTISTAIMGLFLWQGSVSIEVLVSEDVTTAIDSVVGSVGREIGLTVFVGVLIGTLTSIGIVAPVSKAILGRRTT